jgi:hypothetical protein
MGEAVPRGTVVRVATRKRGGGERRRLGGGRRLDGGVRVRVRPPDRISPSAFRLLGRSVLCVPWSWLRMDRSRGRLRVLALAIRSRAC